MYHLTLYCILYLNGMRLFENKSKTSADKFHFTYLVIIEKYRSISVEDVGRLFLGMPREQEVMFSQTLVALR